MKNLSKILQLFVLFASILAVGCTNPSWTFDFSGGETFKGELKIEGLKDNTGYVLCINGKPNRPGNEILYNNYQKSGNEGYYDFKQVQSDNHGKIEITFALELPKGKYDVKFALKELPDYKWIEISSIVVFEIHPKE